MIKFQDVAGWLSERFRKSGLAGTAPSAPVCRMEIRDGRHLGDAYEALAFLPPGLLLDIGAATGATAAKMVRRSPQSTVQAYEPNPNNWPHFERTLEQYPQITLNRAAMADVSGMVRFAARHSIEAGNSGWASVAGGSNIGHVDPDGEFEVPAVTIDDEIGDREVLFTKIDVQGYEENVLKGAKRALQDRRLKMIQAEFMLYESIFPLLEGYVCFSQEWFVLPRTKEPDLSDWELGHERTTSTGRLAYRDSWPLNRPTDSVELVKFQAEQNAKAGRCWTDLLFVAPDFVDEFVQAGSKVRSAVKPARSGKRSRSSKSISQSTA